MVWRLVVQVGTGTAFLGKVCIPCAGNSSSRAAAASRLTPWGCASKRAQKSSVYSAGGEISTRARFLLTEAAPPAIHAPETALHVHKDADLREQLSPAQNLFILVAQCLSVVLRDLCFSHV